jgi:tetratricopeptide (TPR) repeat protein
MDTPMLELWLKFKLSAKLVAWAAPLIQQWLREGDYNREEGDRQLKARNFVEAEIRLKDAIDEFGVGGGSPTARIRLQLQLAEAQRKQMADHPAKLDEAEATVRTALELTARISNPSGYVQCVDALAEVFHDRGDFPAMQSFLEEGVRIEAAMPHPDSIRMARRIHRLGIARHLHGDDGIPALEKAIALFEQSHGEDHVETAAALSEAGILYRAQGLHEDAQRCSRRALAIHGKEYGADSPEATRDLHNLASSHEESGDIEGAAALYERAMELKDRVVGGDQEELAEMQFSVAGLYIEWGNLSRARELMSMCIGTFKRKKGARLAVAYETLAHIEEYSGRYTDALAELARATKIWESCGPERVGELATNMEYRASLLDQMKKKDSANWLRERAAAARAGST